MSSKNEPFLKPFFFLLLGYSSLCPNPQARAQDAEKLKKIDLNAQLTLQYIKEDNTDLGAGDGKDASFSQQLQTSVGFDVMPELRAFAKARALNSTGDTGFQDEETNVSSGGDAAFLELRELYLLKKNLRGQAPLSLQAGRQRIREPRSLWWNSDNDLVRLNYESTLLNGFLAAGEDLFSYRNNTDDDFEESDEDRFRILGETSWQYEYGHFLEGRAAYENDHSGLERRGSIVPAFNQDSEDDELVWFGARARGAFSDLKPFWANLNYRADAIALAGEEDKVTFGPASRAKFRTVTGSRNADVRAWAFDGSVTAGPIANSNAFVTLGYAMGSGDEDQGDGVDHEFRQTDLHSSSSRGPDGRATRRHYGEVLRPELSNIHILNAGIDYSLSDSVGFGASYFYYSLDEKDSSLRSSGVNAPLNGNDKSLGHGVDALLNVDLDGQFRAESKYVKDADLRFIAGSFFPGESYRPNDDETAFRFFSEIKISF